MERSHQNFPQLLPGPLIVCVGFVLNVVGLSATHWSEIIHKDIHAGLWKVCTTDISKTEACFTINQRGSVPPMVFLCSFLTTVSVLIIGMSSVTALVTLWQSKSRLIRWSKNSAAACLIAVMFSVCTECVYGATYKSITYDNIPNWKHTVSGNRLGWSFYITCVSSVLVLTGSLCLIIIPPYILSPNKISTTVPHIPVLQIHPPPSDRTPTPLYLLSQRSTSPLPSPFSSKAPYPHNRSLPPVFTQLRR